MNLSKILSTALWVGKCYQANPSAARKIIGKLIEDRGAFVLVFGEDLAREVELLTGGGKNV